MTKSCLQSSFYDQSFIKLPTLISYSPCISPFPPTNSFLQLLLYITTSLNTPKPWNTPPPLCLLLRRPNSPKLTEIYYQTPGIHLKYSYSQLPSRPLSMAKIYSTASSMLNSFVRKILYHLRSMRRMPHRFHQNPHYLTKCRPICTYFVLISSKFRN